jgi:putative thioredoxin
MQSPRDFSIYGAVDLGARQAAVQRRQQAAQATANGGPSADGAASDHVFDVSEETFNDDVVLRSRITPVIVDLWAEWCGPCKQLSPVLEKLAAEAGGSWVLAKVDVDANPRLAQAFQAQSIPMVVAVVGGQMVDAFFGAMPESQVKQWLTQILAVAEQFGIQAGTLPGTVQDDAVAGDDAEEGDERDDLPAALRPARDAMESGDFDVAARELEKVLAESPGDPIAKTLLAQVNLMRRTASDDPATVAAEADAHPQDIDLQLLAADFDMAAGDAEQAFDRVLGVVKRTSGADKNNARLRLLELFEILPPEDDRIKQARMKLTALLF